MARVKDDMGDDCRVLCITDHDGNVLAGKMPEPLKTYSADFLVACANYGHKAARK